MLNPLKWANHRKFRSLVSLTIFRIVYGFKVRLVRNISASFRWNKPTFFSHRVYMTVRKAFRPKNLIVTKFDCAVMEGDTGSRLRVNTFRQNAWFTDIPFTQEAVLFGK